jgi:hypothetical protein
MKLKRVKDTSQKFFIDQMNYLTYQKNNQKEKDQKATEKQLQDQKIFQSTFNLFNLQYQGLV